MPCPQWRFNGVLRAFGVGWYWDTSANATRCARRFSGICGGVMVWCVCAVCGRPAFPGLIMAAWPLPGPGDMAAPQIVLTGPSTLWRRGGHNPGRDSARRPAQGVAGERRGSWSSGCAHALNLADSRRKSLRKSPGFARKSLIVAKPCINPGKSLPILRKLLNSR